MNTWYRVMLSTMTVLLVGCGSSQIGIYVESTETTNSKRPFYLVIRAVDQKDYVSESYQEVADKVFHDPAKTVLKTEVIYPGRTAAVTLDMPEQLPLGIYFLFTEPGTLWKSFIPQPLPSSIEFQLEGNGIKSQN